MPTDVDVDVETKVDDKEVASNGKVADEDIDFELVTNVRMLGAPPPLRREKVILKNWKTSRGKAVGFFVYELSAMEFSDFQETGRVYKNGSLDSITLKNDDLRFLAFTLRDPNGNRLWSTVDAAIQQLGQYNKSDINRLVEVSNKVNFGDKSDAEGNSDETKTSSSPST